MRMMTRGLPVVGLLLVAASGCHEPSRPRLQSPLVGVWELTTHFDEFSFETPAPSPPDCPGSTWYCTHRRTTTDGAYLGGLIEVRDTSSTAATLTRTVSASGPVVASFCDVIDTQNLTGCVHVSDRATVTYAGQISGDPDSSNTKTLDVLIGEPGNANGDNLVLHSYEASYAGDSVYGPARWRHSGGRSPPTYFGTFVLRRVH